MRLRLNLLRLLLLTAIATIVLGISTATAYAENWEQEPNNETTTATEITLNETWNGSLVSGSGVDWYKFTLSKDGYVRLSFTKGNTDDTSNWYHLRLQDNAGDCVYSEDLKQAKFTSDGIGLAKGTYYLKINGSLNIGDYSFKVAYAASSTWEKEPNDESKECTAIKLNTTWHGSFSDYGSYDYYKFTLSKDGYVRLSFAKPNADDTSTYYSIQLSNATDTIFKDSYLTKAKYTSDGIGLAKGTYYLRLSGKSNLGDYTLKVAYSASSTWEKEPNDETKECTAIKLNTTWHGSFSDYGSYDWYKFTMSSAGNVKISFAKPSADDTSTYYSIYLQNANGDRVFSDTYITKAKYTSDSIGLAKGTYYLRLSGKSSLGDYTFKVTQKAKLSRLAGTDRYKTMAAIAKAGFSSTGGWAIVARGDNFPDALGAAALAGAYSAPIITTTTSSLDASAKAQLNRLKVKNVIVLGNAKSVSTNTFNQIKALSSVKSVKRVSGADRYATSLEVYKKFKSKATSYSTLIVASGESFQDALTAGAYAYKKKAPIVLAKKASGLTSAEVKAIKADKKIKRVVVVSTNGAVSYSKIKSQLGSGYTYKSISGTSYYKTNASFVAWSISQGMTASYPVITTAKKYPDAIAGAPLAGKNNSVLVLADTASNDSIAKLAKYKSQIKHAYLLGDKSTISVSNAKAMASKLGLTYVTHSTDSAKKS